MICDANVNMSYEDNIFSMLGGNLDNFVTLGYVRGYDPFIDPYCVCLKDLLRKVIWTTFFNPSYDFSQVVDKVKKILILFGVVLVIACYLLFSKLWSQEFDMLLQALTMSNLMSKVLNL